MVVAMVSGAHRHKLRRAARLVAAFAALLLVGGVAACAVVSDEPADANAALEQYRSAFARMRPGEIPPAMDDRNYKLFENIFHLVLAAYVKPASPTRLVDQAREGLWKKKAENPSASERALTESAIESMLTALDPYSNFLNADRVRDVREQMHGEFPGLGIEVVIDKETGLLRVVGTDQNTPAARAGVRSGDLITRINDHNVKGVSLHDAVTAMRGPVGGSVTLELLRPGSDVPIQVFVTRAVVQVPSVVYRLLDNVAYIRIDYFGEQAARLVREGLASMNLQAMGNLAGIVLDLRNNPGGLFEQGVNVAGIFLGAVDIVSTRDRDASVRHYKGRTDDDVLPELPLMVLIDSGTTSAAEVVAGALQDHHRALLIGARSYGKGSVQTIFMLPGGDGLRLTTARYFRPSGGPVECFGITPNLEIKPAGRPLPAGLWPRAAETGETHAGTSGCDPGALAPPPPRTWVMTELCPDVVKTWTNRASDGPLECAVAAIRTRRVESALPK